MFNFNVPFFSSKRQFTNNGVSQRPMSPRNSGLLLFLFGLIFAGIGGYMTYDNQQTKDWPITAGAIQNVSSRIEQDSDGNTSTEYSYVLVYTVKDQLYTLSQSSSSYVTNGEQKQVAYNPSKPGDARVRSGATWVAWLFLGIGGAIALLGIGMLIKGNGSTAAVDVSPGFQIPVQPPAPPLQNSLPPQPAVGPNPPANNITPPGPPLS